MTAATPPARKPPAATGTAESASQRARRAAVTASFLLPATVLLVVWIVYPTLSTIKRSFYDRAGSSFIGFDNYKSLFTTDLLTTAIKNNAVWVAVVPAVVTAIGLIFAVMAERIRWSLAFRIAIFMPMAISLFAAGVIWRIAYLHDPGQGTANAAVKIVHDAFTGTGPLTQGAPSSAALRGSTAHGFTLAKVVHPGDVALLGLTAIPPDEIPQTAKDAAKPTGAPRAIRGIVWRDFSPGGGTPGKVEAGELGIPGATVVLKNGAGGQVASATTDEAGAFAFPDLGPGGYHVAIAPRTFSATFGGISWLGPDLITPSIMIAYIWVWAGFAMVIIAAGLAAISREVLEAARTDGATEWQVFRRVTVPMLAPVLSVVFITMLINVLKVFDIILSVAPGSVQAQANVIALAMWRTSFGGVNDFGLGSAIAVLLFLLVVPVLMLNIRRFRREV